MVVARWWPVEDTTRDGCGAVVAAPSGARSERGLSQPSRQPPAAGLERFIQVHADSSAGEVRLERHMTKWLKNARPEMAQPL